MTDILHDFMYEMFGFLIVEVPETIPLRILGLPPSMPAREVIVSAFRRRAIEVHPDLQLAYDHPQMQNAAEAALSEKPEIRELVWARNVLLEMAPRAPDPSRVTAKTGNSVLPPLPVTPKVKICRKCQRELKENECYAVGWGRSPRARWCWRCVQDDDTARAKERRRRRRANKRCAALGCTTVFTPSRSDGRYCSPRCRQVAYRNRVTAKTPTALEPCLAVTVAETESVRL